MDRYIGCPLLYMLGHLRKKQSFPYIGKNPHIALLKTAAIGDTILMDAVIKEIKTEWPESKVTFICSKTNIAMVKMLEHVDHIYNFQMRSPFSSLRGIKKLGPFDLILDFAPWARINGLITYAARGKYKVGFKRKGMYRHYIYDAAVEHQDDLHEIENYRNILRAAQVHVKGVLPCLRIEKNPDIKYHHYAIFHLFPGGSSVSLRSWPILNWLILAETIYKQYGFQILLTGGPEDKEEADRVVKEMQGKRIPAKSIAGIYPLRDMPDILARAEFLVTVNTGIMHMGAAVQVPMVALHGATSEKRWGPLSDKAVVVKSDDSCRPCISLGFESHCEDPICMKHITVDMVMRAVEMAYKKPN